MFVAVFLESFLWMLFVQLPSELTLTAKYVFLLKCNLTLQMIL